MFDYMESMVARQSVERVRVEKMLLGEEINNIIVYEELERRERHEKMERWRQRLDMAGFGHVPLSYYGLLQARWIVQGFDCDSYSVREESSCFFFCWQDRPLFSVSAWRCLSSRVNHICYKDSYVIRDDDAAPTIEAETPTPHKTYAFMFNDSEKM